MSSVICWKEWGVNCKAVKGVADTANRAHFSEMQIRWCSCRCTFFLYLFKSIEQVTCSSKVQWATGSKRQENNLLAVSCSCDWVVILALGPDLWPLCEKWHVAEGMHTSGEVRFLASLVQTSTLLITTRDINPQMVKMIMQQREKPWRRCETIKRPQQLICWGVFAVFARSIECSHAFTRSCTFFKYC